MKTKVVFIPFVLIILLCACSSGSSGSSGSVDIIERNDKKVSEYRELLKNNNYEGAYKKIQLLKEDDGLSDYAKNEIGYFFENGLYVEKNIDTALMYYGDAGNNNYTPAIYNVGRIKMESGQYSEALSILKSIETKKYPPALNLIGIIYNYGYGVEVDIDKSLKYYTEAANFNNPDAQFNIGQLYFKGDVVGKNYGEALKWYNVSSNNGYSLAKLQLGTMYSKGYGVDLDLNKAVNIIEPLANEGNADAIYNIRLYYGKLSNKKEYDYWDVKCKKTIGCDL